MNEKAQQIYQKIKNELMDLIINKYPKEIRHTEVVKEEIFDFLIYEIAKLKIEIEELKERK